MHTLAEASTPRRLLPTGRDQWAGTGRWALGAAVVLGGELALAGMVGHRPSLAVLGAVLVAATVVSLVWPSLLWALALAGNYAYWRVGPSSLDVSVADVLLVGAVVVALPHVPWRNPLLQRALRWFLAYIVVLAVCVATVPTRTALLDLPHRSVMLAGAILIGTAIAAAGRTRLVVGVLALTSAAVAVAAVVTTLGNGFQPAYVLGIHKNASGSLLVSTLLLSLAGRSVLPFPARVITLLQAVWMAGLFATQARGAAVALVVALVVAMLRGDGVRHNPVLLLGGAAMVAAAALSFSNIHANGDRTFNSVDSRVLTYDAAITIWKDHPVFGAGIKFWRDPSYSGHTAFGEPHNAEVSALAETGVIGLGALLALMAGLLYLIGRLRSPLGHAAFLVLVARLVDVQFGIFWVAVTGSFAWIVIGMALAEAGGDSREPSSVPPA